ncbi:MAG TPA: flagellar assembly protein FliX [Magnetospirillaceae bacterium]|jgi:hypothetical protein
MKVSGPGNSAGPSQVRKTGKTDKSSTDNFAKQLGGGPEQVDETPTIDAPAAVASVDALLAAQAVGGDVEEDVRRRLLRRGEDILDRLDELRHALLIGVVPKDRLIQLAQMVRARRDKVADPRLAAVLDEIELRAEVELAKLSRKPG